LLQMQANLVAEVCREVRNPLFGIYGTTKAAKGNVKEIEALRIKDERLNSRISDINDSLDTIHLCANHQKVILDDFIDATKLKAGRLRLTKSPMDIKKPLLDAIAMLKPQAEQKGLTIRSILPEEAQWCKGDVFRIRQVVINLLSNAIKFTKQGTITLSMDVSQKTATHTYFSLIVQDTGPGMTSEEKSRLFNRFSQVTRSLSPSVESTGLGLYITKKLVKLMKGSIQVESEKGKGTTFNCVIRSKPLSLEELMSFQQEEEAATQTLPSSAPNSFSVCTIANNGLEAVKCFQEHTFDIIFMDINMPVMDGLLATKEIRRLETELRLIHIPIIGLSGDAQEIDRAAALEAGMDNYLTKPVRKTEVYQALERYTPASNVFKVR